MTTLFSKIKEVTELSAISGHEAPVRSYLREKNHSYVDEVVTDGLVVSLGTPCRKLKMPCSYSRPYVDEVGFMWSAKLKLAGPSVVPVVKPYR